MKERSKGEEVKERATMMRFSKNQCRMSWMEQVALVSSRIPARARVFVIPLILVLSLTSITAETEGRSICSSRILPWLDEYRAARLAPFSFRLRGGFEDRDQLNGTRA